MRVFVDASNILIEAPPGFSVPALISVRKVDSGKFLQGGGERSYTFHLVPPQKLPVVCVFPHPSSLIPRSPSSTKIESRWWNDPGTLRHASWRGR